MKKREFHNMGELEDASNALATASQHPLYADLSASYEQTMDNLRSGSLGEPDLNLQGDMTVVWNNRDDRRAYVSSEKYHLVQHREVIDTIREAVSGTVGEIEKGMIRDYGERVDGVLVFGNQEEANIDVMDIVDDGYVPPEGEDWVRDRLGLGMRFKNSFDGGTKVGASTMGYRFICANWMVWGEETIGEMEQRHTTELDVDLFEDMIGEVFDTRDDTVGIVVDAESDTFPIAWVPGILENVGFGTNYIKRITGRVLRQNHVSDEETTAWRLYNAITWELDHNSVDKIRNDLYDKHQQKAFKVLSGDWDVDPAAEMEIEDMEEMAIAPGA